MNRRTMLTGTLALASVVALTASCRIGARCDDDERIETRCDTVCSWRCRGQPGYGCFFDCHDVCWDECIERRDEPRPSPSPPVEAGTTPDAPPPGAPLCSPCQSNDDCGGGGLCIQPGADAGAPFCGVACTTNQSCPAGFVCSAVGTNKQCLPASGPCL